MPINSKNKGKTGELEFVRHLKLIGIDASRGQQYSGTSDSPDVRTVIYGTWCEVKRRERVNIPTWLAEASDQAGVLTPWLASRRNRDDWIVSVYLHDVESFSRRFLEALGYAVTKGNAHDE